MGSGVNSDGDADDTGRWSVLWRPGPQQDRRLDDRPLFPGFRHSQHPVGPLRLQPLFRLGYLWSHRRP